MTQEPSDRLRIARIKAGFTTPHDAATARGWNVNTYKSHENGTRGIRTKIAERYALGFGVSAAWVLTGETPPKWLGSENRSPSLFAIRTVPKVRYQDVMGLQSSMDTTLEDATSHVAIDSDGNVGPRAFAIEIIGNAMVIAGTGQGFPDGTVAIFDPDTKVHPGDFVFARVNNQENGVFAQYRERGRDETGATIIDLVPLNVNHATESISADRPGTIIARLVRHIRKY